MTARRLSFICCAGLVACALAAHGDTARQNMTLGLQNYEEGRYEEARRAFEEASQGAADSRLDASAASYNEGNALLRLKRLEEASSKYMDALRSTDLSLQSKAYFNRGNALFHIAEEAQAQGDFDTALRALEQALMMYENAMALDPADRDGKINYELTLRKQEEVKELQEQQQQQQQGEQEQDQQDDQGEDEEQKQQPDEQSEPSDQPDESESDDSSEQQDQSPSQPEEARAEEMTQEEARVLLDAMRQEEQAARERYRVVRGTPEPVEKDW